MINQKIIITLTVVVALLGGIAAQQLLTPEPIAVNARVYEPVRPLKAFTLTNQHGNEVTKNTLKDHWTLVFLGYTHCPDVCPTTLAKLANAYPKLKQSGIDNVQVLFVSVDPQRDDSARLKEYTDYFNSEFIAASGPHKALFPFVRSLGLMYSMTDDTSKPDYAVDHSAGISLINPKGELQAMFKPVEALGKVPHVDMAQLHADMTQLTLRF